MKEKLKILYLPKWYPSRIESLDGIFIKRHAEAVSKYCSVLVLYVIVDPNLKRKWLEFQISYEDDINTLRVYYKKNFTGLGQVDKVIRLFLYIIGVISGYVIIQKKFGKPDIVHVHVLLRTVFLALYLRFFKKIKYLITEHWTGYLPSNGSYQRKNFVEKKLYKIAVKNASLVTPPSVDLGRWMKSWGLISEYTPVFNVVDTELFKNYPQEKNNKKRIIHVSSLIDVHKNVSGLMRVVKRVWEERQDFELLIVGDEFDFEILKRLALKEGMLDKVVYFTGRKVSSELARLLSSGDYLVLFSNYENQPCVINEALACSLPILATSVGGIPEIVSPEVGRLVKPGDENELYKEIIFMLDNSDKYDKKILREYAVNNFSSDTIGRKLFEIYDSVIKK